MFRLFISMLILAITITHGQVNGSLFDDSANGTQVLAETTSDIHFSDHDGSTGNKCCKEKQAPNPVKISYCQIDCGLILGQITVGDPLSRKLNQPGTGNVSVRNIAEMQLRPPIV